MTAADGETIPDGYTYTVKALDIATVGTASYNTLQAAIDAAASSGESITLIRNAVSNDTVTIGGNVTIDKASTASPSTAAPLSSWIPV